MLILVNNVDLLDPIMMAIMCDTEGSALTMYSHGTTIVGEKNGWVFTVINSLKYG